MTFAERLEKMQKEHHETNYKLAKAIGVHQSTVANWKKGMKPQRKHLALIAEHFCCPEEELIKN